MAEQPNLEEFSRADATKGKLTPRRAIRKMCVDCAGGASEVEDCRGDTQHDGACLFYPYRMGKGHPSVKLIRKHCVWCMGGSEKLVRECPSRACTLFAYRMGRNPKRTGQGGSFAPRPHLSRVFSG